MNAKYVRIENPSGHLVCMVDPNTNSVSIKHKDYFTLIQFNADGSVYVQHKKS